MKLLTVNAGSSSLKFATFRLAAEPCPEIRGQLSGIGQGECRLSVSDAAGRKLDWQAAALNSHADALKLLVERLQVDASWAGVGHRVVHGGTRFTAPICIDAEVLSALKALYPLAPLHQPHNVAAIEAVAALLPRLPQVACFDTAFHAGQPEIAVRFALPERYWQQGIRRYGFHGLSYEAILHRLPEFTGGIAGTIPSRLVIAHLGNGASLAAVKDGRCIATTMGFSTLDGLVMGTRAGLLDPGVILHLMRNEGLDLPRLERLLYHESGLKALSTTTADMKALLASGDPRAKLAIEIYAYRISRELGSLAAALGGIDALVFTGGVGENAAPIRAKVCEAAGWLGLAFDPMANSLSGPRISATDSPVSAWAIPTDEELTIARHSRRLLASLHA